MTKIYFISGHLNVSDKEFQEHYIPKIDKAIEESARFVIGEARGADSLAQQYLSKFKDRVVVHHMSSKPRNNYGNFECVGGFKMDEERDIYMTNHSDIDIAWVREGREKSGTAQNLQRRDLCST